MLIKTNNKEKAFHAVINTWLKDKTMYCNFCGQDYKDDVTTPCCENPQVGRNMDHCMGIIKQNKMIRETRKNEFGSTDDKTLRYGVSMPPALYQVLDRFKVSNDKPKLFREDGEMVWFMKKFPQFTTCSRV